MLLEDMITIHILRNQGRKRVCCLKLSESMCAFLPHVTEHILYT